jgi:hypothetical protein
VEEIASWGLTPHAAAALSDRAEALAFTDLYAAAPPALRSQLGLRVERVADATLLVASGLPSPMFNRVIGLGLEQPAALAEVEAINAVYKSAGCTNWWLHWNPYAKPEAMTSLLADLGFVQPARRSWAKMLRGPERAPRITTDLQVVAAHDAQAARAIGTIVQAFEMPPLMAGPLRCLDGRPHWRIYAMIDGRETVGGAFLFTAGDIAWLGMGFIDTAHRRRGGQAALMSRRIADAIAGGARHLVTETGEPVAGEPSPSLGNMKRCGFVNVASRLNFCGPA